VQPNDLPRKWHKECSSKGVTQPREAVKHLRRYLQGGIRCTIKYDNRVHMGSRVVGDRVESGKRKATQRDAQLRTGHIRDGNGTARQGGNEETKGCIWQQANRSMCTIELWNPLGTGWGETVGVMIGVVYAGADMWAKEGVTGNRFEGHREHAWESLTAARYKGRRRRIPIRAKWLNSILLGVLGRILHREW